MTVFRTLLVHSLAFERGTVYKSIYKGENSAYFMTFLSVKYPFGYLPLPLEAVIIKSVCESFGRNAYKS